MGKEGGRVDQSALNSVLLAAKMPLIADLLGSGCIQGTLLNKAFFFLISSKQRDGKQSSLRTAGSVSKEGMAVSEVLVLAFDE